MARRRVNFQTTPLGTQHDLQVFDDTFKDNDWDALWRVQTHVTDSGYYAEFAIPFKSLRYERTGLDSAPWGVTFARMARSFLQYSVTPTWQRIDFNFSVFSVPIAMKDYFYTRQKIDYNTDQSKKYSLNGSYEWGLTTTAHCKRQGQG